MRQCNADYRLREGWAAWNSRASCLKYSPPTRRSMTGKFERERTREGARAAERGRCRALRGRCCRRRVQPRSPTRHHRHKIAAAKQRCNSRSVGTAHSQRHVRSCGASASRTSSAGRCRIPLNERADRAEALERRAVEFPNGAADGGRMSVDQELARSPGARRCGRRDGFPARQGRDGTQILAADRSRD